MRTDMLQVAGLAIPLAELQWNFDTSGGKGGQHANRARTRAEVTFDVVGSPSLTERQRERLRSRIGDVVKASAAEERSQARNRDLALERLRSRLAAGLHQDPPRRATRPTRGSKERRLTRKRQRSEVKRGRGRPTWSD